MRLDRFQKLALVTTGATYLLIAVGGLVRAAGAGLGCPDWPKCFGKWIPPTRVEDVPSHIDPALFNVAKTWTEYVNRLIGVSVGFLIFATVVLALIDHRRSPRVLWPTLAAFVLVGFEGWLGGQVVAHKLAPAVLTAHLVFALIVVSLLLYATVSAFFPKGGPGPLPAERIHLGRASVFVAVVLLVQIGIGAALRGEVQLVSHGLPRAEWLSGIGGLDMFHRNAALLTTAAVLWLVWRIQAEPDRWIQRAAHLATFLVVGQVLVGFGLAYAEFPPALQVLHLWFPSLLLGDLMVICLLAYRLDPRRAEPAPALV